MFRLSNRSKSRLEGVDPRLVECVHRAIKITSIDFGVTQGLRTLEEQKALFDRRATKTMNSKHLTGHAVDLVAYIGPRVSWELAVYDDIADAMQEAAIEVGVPIRWGGAWQIPDIREWTNTMQFAQNKYVDLRRSQGRRPFIDAPHFEVNE